MAPADVDWLPRQLLYVRVGARLDSIPRGRDRLASRGVSAAIHRRAVPERTRVRHPGRPPDVPGRRGGRSGWGAENGDGGGEGGPSVGSGTANRVRPAIPIGEPEGACEGRTGGGGSVGQLRTSGRGDARALGTVPRPALHVVVCSLQARAAVEKSRELGRGGPSDGPTAAMEEGGGGKEGGQGMPRQGGGGRGIRDPRPAVGDGDGWRLAEPPCRGLRGKVALWS